MPHVHNGLHEYTRLLDAAARAIGEKSGAQDFTGIERFGETLTPIMDLWALPEWALLRGEFIFSRSVGVAAAAGLLGSFELVNPANSGVLAVVLHVRNLVNQALQFNVDTGVALGAVATARGLANDCRYPQLGEVSRCTLVTGQLAAPVALPQDQLNDTTMESLRPYIIQPGKKLVVIGVVVNTAQASSWLWTERVLLPTESRA